MIPSQQTIRLISTPKTSQTGGVKPKQENTQESTRRIIRSYRAARSPLSRNPRRKKPAISPVSTRRSHAGARRSPRELPARAIIPRCPRRPHARRGVFARLYCVRLAAARAGWCGPRGARRRARRAGGGLLRGRPRPALARPARARPARARRRAGRLCLYQPRRRPTIAPCHGQRS